MQLAGRIPPTVVEVSDDAGRNREHSVEPSLISKNLPKHRKEPTERKNNKDKEDDWTSPDPTADERLLQAKDYLANENYDSDPHFMKRNIVIGKLLRRLAKSKESYDNKIYDDVQHMVRVPTPKATERLANAGMYLSKANDNDTPQLQGAPLQDHPPFTIERPKDHDEFGKALRAYDTRGKRLRKIEQNAFSEALEDPTLIQEILEEDHEQTQDERFNTRAANRGRKRAAVQIALRSFATNQEQHFEGGWKDRILPLPEPVDPVLAIPAAEEDDANNDKPLLNPKKAPGLQNPVKQPLLAQPPSHARRILKATAELHLSSLANRLFDAILNIPDPTWDEEPDETDIQYIGQFFQKRIDESGLPTPLSIQDRAREVLEFCEEHEWYEISGLGGYWGEPHPGSELIQYTTPLSCSGD